MHDPALARFYVAIGSPGVVSVIDAHRLVTLETVPTEFGAHTIGWNPDTRTLYAFLPGAGAPQYSLNGKLVRGGEMATSKVESAERLHNDEISVQTKVGLWPLTGYLLKLGTFGFGGPVALVGFMHRDLVEKRRWITEDTYKLSLALAQIMPGPLAAQIAIAIGYFEGGVLGQRWRARFCHPVVFDGGGHLAGLRLVWRALVDAGALLRHRRNGDRDHRYRCL